jgi:D-arabinose 1-dehydrogenase-like Zn-dependent alcohol dehydrogenase
MVKVARWARARRVIAIDVAAAKLEACVGAGADETIDATAGPVEERLLELTGGKGIDVAIDFVCTSATQQAAMRGLGKGGRLAVLSGNGEPFAADPAAFLRNELELLGSRYATRQEVLDSLELVARGELWPLVTETMPLQDAEALHQRLERGLITGRAALLMS